MPTDSSAHAQCFKKCSDNTRTVTSPATENCSSSSKAPEFAMICILCLAPGARADRTVDPL